MNSFSAKDLVVKSCMQIKMFAVHPEIKPQPSAMVNYGEKFQKAVANTIPNIIGEEMRGRYIDSVSGIVINFSNDIVCSDKIIEVKSVSYSAPDWYFNSSILQCALYKSLILVGASHLETAQFYVSLGNERVETYIDANSIRYILIFGEEKYEIFVSNPYEIVSFFVNKAKCCNDWAMAKEWDSKYKHLEYQCLEKYIKYKPIF